MRTSKFIPLFCAAIFCCIFFAAARRDASAQNSPKAFLGRWDITAKNSKEEFPLWLEVRMDGGQIAGSFLNHTGSVLPLPAISVENDELVFSLNAREGQPKPMHRAKIVGGKLMGTGTRGNETITWTGVRPPRWGAYNANAAHKMGASVELFDGTTMNGWDVQYKDRPLNWSVADGAMTNAEHANNIISRQQFKDFKIHAEYKLEQNSNSGIYLRGRYELQVLDDYGKEPESHGHMSLYSRVKPLVNASLPAGEWQTMEATIVGNRVSVTLNGKTVQDNTVIDGITGGALDSNEAAPGPIMLQGDHGKVWFRKVTVTPIVK